MSSFVKTITSTIVAVLMLSVPAIAGPTLVVDAKSGRILHEDGGLKPWYPASLTKLMTAYVLFKAIDGGYLSLNSEFVYTARARQEPPSKLGLPVGSTMTADLALQALMVKSANDVAVMIAEGVSGSVEEFVREMNAAANALGMSHTRFANPNGLPHPNQITNARDMAILAQVLIKQFPHYKRYFSQGSVKIGKRIYRSYNPLLKGEGFPGGDGMKTGYICASGFNLVGSATRNGRQLIAVVLGATSGKKRKAEVTQLLNNAFEKKSGSIFSRKIDNLKTNAAFDVRPTHMGPEVCKRRYAKHSDPHALDAYKRKLVALQKNPPQPTMRPILGLDTIPDVQTANGEVGLPIPLTATSTFVPVGASTQSAQKSQLRSSLGLFAIDSNSGKATLVPVPTERPGR